MTARWLVVLLLLLTFDPARGGDVDLQAQLMDADRRFAAEVAAGGLEAWLSFMADDAVRLPAMGLEGIQGHADIAAADSALFADPTRRLTWEPTAAGVFAGGDLGYTTGTYRFIVVDEQGQESALLGRGRYLTWWRRGADGRWQVIFDTGEADPPASDEPSERQSP